MEDLIHLLSDVVANQIAAGEVIQRPASAVKELLENAVDAGADNIQLIIKDSGRTLIQVIDNGKGMSFNDSRLCFERHATSKITTADDLFHISTKGFRGEALASIAAISQVELKSKQIGEKMGTLVITEGSQVKEHSLTVAPDGTSISVKNLFFNVPARRNFLKSDSIEFSHIEEEFNRVALIHYNISFSLFHQGKLVCRLTPSNFKQRIVNLFGAHFKDKLYPIEQNSDNIRINGFIAKPENAKKKKSEQYLFINNRYVRHNLLNYAIETAYSELIPEGYRPAYFIHLELDPSTIDINISPTKIDVKLQDERLIFGFLNSTVKKSLGTMSLTPRLDFDYERGLDFGNIPHPTGQITPPSVTRDPHYNPFDTPGSGQSFSSGNFKQDKSQLAGWEDFMKGIKTETIDIPSGLNHDNTLDISTSEPGNEQHLPFLTIGNSYLVIKLIETLSIIDIVRARERILYEYYLNALINQPIAIQQNLFPETISLTAGNAEILQELKDDFRKLGYDIESIGRTQFAVNGTPNNEERAVTEIIEDLIESYKSNQLEYRSEKEKNIALTFARQQRSLVKPMTSEIEVKEFLRQLFDCQVINTTPSGKKIIHSLPKEILEGFFR